MTKLRDLKQNPYWPVFRRYTGTLIVAILIFLSMSCGGGRTENADRHHVSGPRLDDLINSYGKKKSGPGELKEFLIETEKTLKIPDLVRNYTGLIAPADLKAASLSSDPVVLYRLLGVYTRLKHEQNMLETLATLVALPTAKAGERPQYKNPAIIQLGLELKKLAERFGLKYRNVDNRIFEITLAGQGGGEFGIYTHGDVVPANKKLWVLPGGRELNPYKMEIIEGKIYGRGTEDDKTSIVAALYAMREIKASGLPLKRSIRLIVETTEETGGEGFEYYKNRGNRPPEYNVVLDSSYPVVTAEKGYGVISVKFKKRQGQAAADTPVLEVLKVTGGLAVNQIPAESQIILKARTPEQAEGILRKIKSLAASYEKSGGGKFRLEVTGNMKERIILRFLGESAHSSQPEKGVNPTPRALEFLHQLREKSLVRENHYTDAAEYAVAFYGSGFYGKKLGISYEDEFMGPLTVALTYLREDTDRLEIAANTRIPRGRTAAQIKAKVGQALEKFSADYQQRTGFVPEIQIEQREPMYRAPDGAWIATLLNIFSEQTGREARPVSSSGTTTAQQLSRAVNFGPSMPGEKYMGHTALEFKRLRNFYLDVRMFTEMFLRISNLEKMESGNNPD